MTIQNDYDTIQTQTNKGGNNMEENKIKEAVEEIKTADENQLKQVIEDWFEKTRTSGMKVGATFIAAGVYGVIEKNLKKATKPSLRDYQRTIKRILEIVSVQLATDETIQNDYKEENTNDGTTEEINRTDSNNN